MLLQSAIPEAFFAVVSGGQGRAAAAASDLVDFEERCHIYRVQLDQLDDWVATYEKWSAPDAKQSDADMAMPASYVALIILFLVAGCFDSVLRARR